MAKKKKQDNALALLQSDALDGLQTDKQKLFVIHYVESLNATDAARKAGYDSDYDTLSAIGYENLRKPQIRSAVDRLLSRQVMSEAKALNRLAQHARADIGELIRVDESGCVVIDLQVAKEKGLTHLIRKLKTKTTRRYDGDSDGVEIEQTIDVDLQDQQAALDKILKAHGTYRDSESRLHVQINSEHLAILQQFNQGAE